MDVSGSGYGRDASVESGGTHQGGDTVVEFPEDRRYGVEVVPGALKDDCFTDHPVRLFPWMPFGLEFASVWKPPSGSFIADAHVPESASDVPHLPPVKIGSSLFLAIETSSRSLLNL